MDKIKWLFFDIGSTLVDESRVYERRFRQIAKSADVSEELVRRTAEVFYREGKKGDRETARMYGAELPQWEPQYEVLYGDAEQTLMLLSKKYSIGIIANQEYGTEKRLISFGIRQYIDLITASAEEGVAKPDPQIFLLALARAGCKPDDAAMIGDRLDNDIAPANRLGMTTVRVMRGFGALAKPLSEEEKPDYTVNSLYEITEIF